MATKKEHQKVGMTPDQADSAMSALTGAVSTFNQLEALFKAIAKGCNDTHSDTEELANMGAYLACDIGNLTDCMREDLELGEVKK